MWIPKVMFFACITCATSTCGTQDNPHIVVARYGHPAMLPCAVDLDFDYIGWRSFSPNAYGILAYFPGSDVTYFMEFTTATHKFRPNDNSMEVVRPEENNIVYQCYAEHLNGRRQLCFNKITVYEPPSALNVSVMFSNVIEENQSRVVECKAFNIFPGEGVVITLSSDGNNLHADPLTVKYTTANGFFTASARLAFQFVRSYNTETIKCTSTLTVAGIEPIINSTYLTYCDISIDGGAGSQTKNVDDIVYIECNAGCIPAQNRTIALMRSDGTTVDTRTESRTSYIYSFSYQLRKADNGFGFYCDVDGKMTVDIFYIVKFKPSRISFTQNPNRAPSPGQSATYQCETDEANPPANIRWSLSGIPNLGNLSTSNQENITSEQCSKAYGRRSRLTISSVQKEYNGRSLTCQVKGVSGLSDTRVLDVTFKATSVSITPHSTSLLAEGENATFECVTNEANPRAVVTWSWNGQGNVGYLRNSKRNGQCCNAKIRKSTLTKSNVQRNDNGKRVKCSVSDTNLEDSAVINVKFKATSVSITPHSTSLLAEGVNATFECVTDKANPTAVVTWSWNGQGSVGYLRNSEENGQCCNAKIRKSTLTKINVQRNDNGKRVRCSVSDTNLEDSAVINVKFKATFVSITPYSTSLLAEGENATFECVTDEANPTAVVTWSWNGQGSVGYLRNSEENGQCCNAKIRKSTLTKSNVQRNDNGKRVRCSVSDTNLEDSAVINVTFPHTVQVTSCENVDEMGDCTLICSATDGNPEEVLSYTWSFQSRIQINRTAGFVTQDNDGRMLVITNASYKNAGQYKCVAKNEGGDATGSTVLTVKYAPVVTNLDVPWENVRRVFSEVEQDAELKLIVHGYNVPSFKWIWESAEIESNENVLNDTHTESTVTRRVTSANNRFGNYTVTISSGFSFQTEVIVMLKQRGKPGPIHNFQLLSISYREVQFSFDPGVDGGYPQTITTNYKQGSDRNYISIYDKEGPTDTLHQTISDLKKTTDYTILVISDNEHSSGSRKEYTHEIRTRDTLASEPKGLLLSINHTNAMLSWLLPDGDFTNVTIRQCNDESECTDHDITTASNITLSTINGSSFSLLVYQDLDAIYLQTFHQRHSKNARSGKNVGAIVGPVLGILVLFITFGAIFLLWTRRKSKLQGQQEENVYVQPAIELDPVDIVYTSLSTGTVTSTGNPALQETIVENVHASEIAQEDVIHIGSYALIKNGQFRGVTCAVKLLKEKNSRLYDIKWILSQMQALKEVPVHKNIAMCVGFNDKMGEIVLLTKYETHRDLKTYLLSGVFEPMYMNKGTVHSIEQTIRFALDIVSGMQHLRTLSLLDILHFELSARHILVGSDLTCKIINFASGEDVRKRQKYSMEMKDLTSVPWMAPECLLSAEEHCAVSDVWSFGVLLYELAANGNDPYSEHNLDDIGAYVLQGHTMDISNVTNDLAPLMSQCWTFEPSARPGWKELHSGFESLRNQIISSAYEEVKY